MKGIQNHFKSSLFCFHGNYGKVCPTNSDVFGLSRSTKCECCSYQISSISVWRVTCYDHFCVFQFFLAFWTFPWQMPPFWFCWTLKAATHYSGYSYKASWSLMKGIQNYFKSPLFCVHGNCGKVCPTNSDLLAYLVPLAVDVVPIKFHQFLFRE
jgi:hypothetical protein